MNEALDEKIERRLLQKGLGEVSQNLQKVSVALQKDSQTDEKILAAIQENSRVFNVFLERFKDGFTPEIKVEAPNVKVETNQKEVVTSIQEQNKLLQDIIINQQSIIQLSKSKPQRLQVERNSLGFIKHIDIQY